MINGCREPPYPSVLTDATMEKLALTKFVCQETHCEVCVGCCTLLSQRGLCRGQGKSVSFDFNVNTA